MTEELPTSPPAEAGGSPRALSLASVGRSAAILTGATAAMQLLAIVRELFLAAQIGVSSEFDALLIGLVLPTTLSSVLTSGVTHALVPAYLQLRQTGTRDARRLAGTILVWVVIAALVVTALLELLAPALVAVAGPGLSPAGRDQAAAYLRLLAPITIVAGANGIVYAVCQAEEQFRWIAVSVVAGSATTLAILLAMWSPLGLDALAIGTLVGPVIGLMILVLATMRRQVMPSIHLVSRGLGIRALARHALPLTVSSAVLQLNAVFDRAIASLLGPGAVSALRYGDTLVRVPVGAISPAWGAAIYPALVRSAQTPGGSALGSSAGQGLRYLGAIFVPISALTLAVAPVAVSAAYGRGAFTQAGLDMTALVVAGFAPLVCTLMMSQTLTGALNARRAGSVLLAAGILNVILNCVLDVVLGLSIGVAGVALSTSITAIVVATFKARQLARREADFQLRPLARKIVVALGAALPGALVCGALAWTGHYPSGFFPGLATLAVFGILGLISYFVLATRLGLEEPQVLVRSGFAQLARRRAPSGSPR